MIGNSDNSHDFFLDFLVPFHSRQDRVMMLNFTLNLNNYSGDTADEENIGFVYRGLLYNDQLILGFNTFLDTRQTIYNNRFYRVGIGLEAMSQWLDFRANYYHPTSDEARTPALDRFSSGGPTGTLVTLGFEEPLKGWDAELGALVPLLSNYLETRVIFGLYGYYSSFVDDIYGRKARIELRPNNLLTFNAEFNDDDISSSTYLGGYLTIPIPFSGKASDIFNLDNSFGQGSRDLKARMYDKTERDRHVKILSGPIGPTVPYGEISPGTTTTTVPATTTTTTVPATTTTTTVPATTTTTTVPATTTTTTVPPTTTSTTTTSTSTTSTTSTTVPFFESCEIPCEGGANSAKECYNKPKNVCQKCKDDPLATDPPNYCN
jgi:hypothetical protein